MAPVERSQVTEAVNGLGQMRKYARKTKEKLKKLAGKWKSGISLPTGSRSVTPSTTSEARAATSIRASNGSVTVEDHTMSCPIVPSSAPTTTADSGFSNTIDTHSTNATQYTSRSARAKPLVLAPAAKAVDDGKAKLRWFPQIPIPAATYERFVDLQFQLKTELANRITPMTAPSNVGWELKVVGITQADAVPVMVFTADKKVAKLIRKFFKEKHIKEILKASGPPIVVHVLDIPPPPLTTNVPIRLQRSLQTDRSPKTLCGTLAKATLGDQSTYGTIGGAVEVDGAMYCMVAKHLLTGLTETSPTKEAHNSDDEESSDSSEDFDMSELTGADTLGTACSPNEIPPTNFELPEFHLVGVDSDQKDLGLDWAAIPLNDHESLPNILDKSALGVGKTALKDDAGSLELRCSGQNAFKKRTSLSVILLSAHGLKVGVLEQQHATILLAHGRRFRKVLTLTVQKESKLQSGDSGSWVVNRETGEVYGHLVTANAFGNGFVIPMRDVLYDMQHRFKTRGVRLPVHKKARPDDTEEKAHEMESQTSQRTAKPLNRVTVYNGDLTTLPGPRDSCVTTATDSTNISQETIPTENRSCSTSPTSEGQPAALLLPPDPPVVCNSAGRVYDPSSKPTYSTGRQSKGQGLEIICNQGDRPLTTNRPRSRDGCETEDHKRDEGRERRHSRIKKADFITRWMSSLGEHRAPRNPGYRSRMFTRGYYRALLGKLKDPRSHDKR